MFFRFFLQPSPEKNENILEHMKLEMKILKFPSKISRAQIESAVSSNPCFMIASLLCDEKNEN